MAECATPKVLLGMRVILGNRHLKTSKSKNGSLMSRPPPADPRETVKDGLPALGKDAFSSPVERVAQGRATCAADPVK